MNAASDSGEGRALLAGLQRRPRQISPRYLYDDRGAALFEEICALPEYYPTRTELSILESHRAEIAARVGPGALVIEPGSGAGVKTRMILDALEEPAAYVPVDISRQQLFDGAARLSRDYPAMTILPVHADFTARFTIPITSEERRRMIFFPGSTIGNFPRRQARTLLRRLRQLAGPGGRLLVGVDLVKDPELLRRAYNDSAGVTAEFNLNVLHHLNARFSTGFTVSDFRHRAEWLPEGQRIEMQLWCRRTQEVIVDEIPLTIAAGEKLVTEWSHKYTVDGFATLAQEAGWHQRQVWLDDRKFFSVQYFESHKELRPLCWEPDHWPDQSPALP